MNEMKRDEIRNGVRENYAKVAVSSGNACGCNASCCSPSANISVEDLSLKLGYTVDNINVVPEGANMGLGCGNPQAIASLKPGEIVLDLGSGGGFDCFLAAKQVGDSGYVIGVDMTPEMISKARANAEKVENKNVEFRLGEIENLPVADGVIDVIISNCVINLSTDKQRVFSEAFRTLKNGGRLAVSDIVAFADIPEDVRNDMNLYSGCIGGAALVSEIESMLHMCGFEQIRVTPKAESKLFIKDWMPGMNITDYIVSASIEAVKPLFISHNNDDVSKLRKIVFPFQIKIDPMNKLLLVNFEKDPDSVYIGFEPQVFNDDINGVGHIILGWRKDKKVDVYCQKSVNVDASKYSIAGAGLNEIIPVEMDKAFYEVTTFGVQAHYVFKDILGRHVELLIAESNPAKRRPFGILAPMGDAASNPTTLPLIFLRDFYFVRKRMTRYVITIDGKSHKSDDLPIPMDWHKMTFMRYCPNPLIATLNPDYNGILDTYDIEIGQKTHEREGCTYELEWDNQTPCVKSMRVNNNFHSLSIYFSPSFPCLNTISDSARFKGSFVISGYESIGTVSGEYIINSDGEGIRVTVVPSGGWRPRITKLSTLFLFSVAKVFKKWPTTYRWDAQLKKSPEEIWHMKSKWSRTGKIL